VLSTLPGSEACLGIRFCKPKDVNPTLHGAPAALGLSRETEGKILARQLSRQY
jgi:hypothetical protein